MHVRHLFLCSLLLIPCGTAWAGPDSVAQPAAERRQPEIVIDDERQAIRFLIDGREVARVDASGLTVRKNIVYGGSLTDTGEDWIEEHWRGDRSTPGAGAHEN